ncbi:MAG: NAD(P)-dependent alcohol dehydrogenase [Alphaproteobacteria bacterium]|nr:NAD(P)-dependent alcohol dehydrogenase [Alphaproteobacteria bacterium]MCB9791101.1 NAD(P)-dependent alcohol dehydrogenase [Alphaproteobacteria bacterium]
MEQLARSIRPLPSTSRAVVFPRYGGPDVLQHVERPLPTPAADEVLIAVRAASVNAADWHLMRADPWLMRLMTGLVRPKSPALGADVAGVVVAAGPEVQRLKVGDAVMGDLSDQGFGAFAEYVCARETHLVALPRGLSFEQAAAVPMAGVTALKGVQEVAGVKAGQRVLVLGASGGVGAFAVQLARHLGAEVTAVCSTEKVDAVRRLGAARVVDHRVQDVTRLDERFDVILDAAAYRSFLAYRRILSEDGVYVMVGGALGTLLQLALLGPILSRLGGQRFANYLSVPDHAALSTLAELLAAGAIVAPVDRSYPLAQVPDAIRALEARRVTGKLVITIQGAAHG